VGLPPEVVASDARDASDATGTGDEPLNDDTAGTMVRTAARVFLVDDLDRSLAELALAFGWEPERGPARSDDGSRRAVLGFRLPQSARVELLEPAEGTEAGAYLRAWGPGVWSIRIAVTDLDAKADDLRARGTPFARVRTGFDDLPVILQVDPQATPACRFEFGPVVRP
jgi:Glyoxalase/Bleomycin resistance protein/Dioxygenase superfamily